MEDPCVYVVCWSPKYAFASRLDTPGIGSGPPDSTCHCHCVALDPAAVLKSIMNVSCIFLVLVC